MRRNIENFGPVRLVNGRHKGTGALNEQRTTPIGVCTGRHCDGRRRPQFHRFTGAPVHYPGGRAR